MTDPQMQRLIDYMWEAYPQYENPEDPSEGTKTKNPANMAAAFRDHCSALWRGIKSNAKRHEKVTAAKNAADAVPDIEDDG